MGRLQQQPQQQPPKGAAAGGRLDALPPKALACLFSLLPTSALLALRGCSKAHYASFHALNAPHWDAVSRRLVVELHTARLRLETASDICGPHEEAGAWGATQPHAAPPKRLVARPLVVGHRGASGHKPPGNSLESFHHAVALGADMIELDVCLDRSGTVVVHHDTYLKATGQLLATLTLPEIRRVAPEVEPLAVVLRELQASGVALYLDLKTDRVVAPLMRILHEAIESGGWHPTRLLVASFNQHDIGIEVNAHRLAFPHTLGKVQTCVIVDGVPIHLSRSFEQLGAAWVSVGDGCVLPSFLADAHRRGIGVMVWTVNAAAAMERYLAAGIDAIVTDFPDRFVAVRAQAEAEEEDARREGGPKGGPKQQEQQEQQPTASQGSPKRPREAASQDGRGGQRPALLSAYPHPLHQPRQRLVAALRQAWPLLRALEGRRPHASHSPPTPTANQARRQQLLSTLQIRDPRNADCPPGGDGGMAASATSLNGGVGLVAHVRAAARQAEDVATAVLQPRLRRQPPQQQQQQQQQQQEGDPRTPPRGDEGEKGAAASGGPTACGLMGSSPTSSTRGSRSTRDHLDEHEHDWPFLPFERKWAAQTTSCS